MKLTNEDRALRCFSVSSGGKRCDLFDGHDDLHQANNGDVYAAVMWRTTKETRFVPFDDSESLPGGYPLAPPTPISENAKRG